MIKRIIQWLQDIETRKYRGCHLCAHINEPQDVYSTSDMVILSPCYGCDRSHDCFQLDYEKMAEQVELGLMTKGEAKHVCQRYENDENRSY